MAQSDIHGVGLGDLFTRACMHRVNQAEPGRADTITISREVFDQLVDVVHEVTRMNMMRPELLSVRSIESGQTSATLDTELFGRLHTDGRTMLEAIVKMKWELDCEIDRRIN